MSLEVSLDARSSEPSLRRRVFVGAFFAAIAGAVLLPARQGVPSRIDVRVGVAPTPFTGSDGQTHLAYELILGGLSGTNRARLESVEVFGDAQTEPLVIYTDSELNHRAMRPEADRNTRYGREIPGGITTLIHVWISLRANRALPRSLRHALTISAEDGSRVEAGNARVDVQAAPPIVLGWPFRTGAWLAHNGPGQHRSSHWGSALVNARGASVPQRYAIDFIGIGNQGSAVRGDLQKAANGDVVGFGHEVLAVADGVVHAARDGEADKPPLVELPPSTSPSADATYGNYVIISAGRTFVSYAHLQRNSVTVKTGQAVRRGQVIGRLGNSGNTNLAHLHFNVTDGPLPEAAQGVPFVFDAFELLGSTTAGRALGAEPSAGVFRFSPSKRSKELTLDGSVARHQ